MTLNFKYYNHNIKGNKASVFFFLKNKASTLEKGAEKKEIYIYIYFAL